MLLAFFPPWFLGFELYFYTRIHFVIPRSISDEESSSKRFLAALEMTVTAAF